MREPLVPVLGCLPDAVRGFELPTPFPVGPVNCYVLLDDPVTVIDPGMLYGDTIETLTSELAEVGRHAERLGPERAQVTLGLLAGLGLAARDHDLRPGGGVALGERAADAARPAGHDDDAAFHGEESLELGPVHSETSICE